MEHGPTKKTRKKGIAPNAIASLIKRHRQEIRPSTIIMYTLPVPFTLLITIFMALEAHKWPTIETTARYFLLTTMGTLAGNAIGWITTRSRRKEERIGRRIYELSEKFGCTPHQLSEAVKEAMMQHNKFAVLAEMAVNLNDKHFIENIVDWAEKHEGLIRAQLQATSQENTPPADPSGPGSQ